MTSDLSNIVCHAGLVNIGQNCVNEIQEKILNDITLQMMKRGSIMFWQEDIDDLCIHFCY